MSEIGLSEHSLALLDAALTAAGGGALADAQLPLSVGVARYIRDHERRDRAEIAVAILEPWQGRGIGKALLHRLADRAPGRGHHPVHSAHALR